MPSIPPIFHNCKFVSDFKGKASLFNSFFASQCTPVSNSSVLSDISLPMNTRLNSSITTEKDIIITIILNYSKNNVFFGSNK